MPDVKATDASRNFSDLLDAVEHRGESYTIVRHGKAVARLEPTRAGTGRHLKALLRDRKRDAEWVADLQALRRSLTIEEREWHD